MYIKVLRRKHMPSPQREGPYVLLLNTHTAIQKLSPPRSMQAMSKLTQITTLKTIGRQPL